MITVDELLDTWPDINGYEVIYIENYNGGVNLHVYKFDE